jgi:hypothetical protein
MACNLMPKLHEYRQPATTEADECVSHCRQGFYEQPSSLPSLPMMLTTNLRSTLMSFCSRPESPTPKDSSFDGVCQLSVADRSIPAPTRTASAHPGFQASHPPPLTGNSFCEKGGFSTAAPLDFDDDDRLVWWTTKLLKDLRLARVSQAIEAILAVWLAAPKIQNTRRACATGSRHGSCA